MTFNYTLPVGSAYVLAHPRVGIAGVIDRLLGITSTWSMNWKHAIDPLVSGRMPDGSYMTAIDHSNILLEKYKMPPRPKNRGRYVTRGYRYGYRRNRRYPQRRTRNQYRRNHRYPNRIRKYGRPARRPSRYARFSQYY